MVQRTGSQGEGNILFVQNNFYYDAFFLKAIGWFSSIFSFDCALTSCVQFSTELVVLACALRRIAVLGIT